MADPGARLVVVKLGGSLLDWPETPARLRSFLNTLRSDRVVLVVGGGASADVIRELDRIHAIGEERAHWLAVRSLTLTAHVAAELFPGTAVVEDVADLHRVHARGATPILAPFRFLRDDPDPLPRSWGSTTDSVAARVADRLRAVELAMLKSVTVPEGTTLREAAERGWVDPVFPGAAGTVRSVRFVNLREFVG